MPNIIKDQNGTHPLVFKRVDASETKIRPVEINKRFYLTSGSDANHGDPLDKNPDFMPLFANYESETISMDPFTFEAYKFDSPEIRDDLRINANGMYAFNVYNSINHLFYKYKHDALKSHGMVTPADKSTKILYQSASVFSIPQKKMGLKCKHGSFYFSGSVNLQSDIYENIIDSAINTGSFVYDEVFYEGFNEFFDKKRIDEIKYDGPIRWWTTSNYSNLQYLPGVEHSNGAKGNVGLAAYFSGSSHLVTNDYDWSAKFDRDHDYAISFYISSGSNTGINDDLIITKTQQPWFYRYPFRVDLSGSNQLKYSVSGAPNLKMEITSSIYVSSSWTHVVCQKTGSKIEMYIDSVLHNSLDEDWLKSSDELTFKTASAVISNKFPIKIGGYQENRRNLYAYLDELRIYNKALSSAEISSLADRTEGGGMLQTNRVGNAFHNNGMFVITSPDPRYNNILNSQYTASYQSSIHIFEFSTICKIDMGDFNMTTNYSALKDDNETYMTHVTSSAFEPYITTIGLYNEHAQLLAIGKLANPVKNRNDVDMNILVRCDLDQDRFAKITDTNEFD